MGQAFACCRGHAASVLAQDGTVPLLPSWVNDSQQDRCFQCLRQFDLVHRKHHCRRCRNIYCASCTAYEARLLMYGCAQPVRVCRLCHLAATDENHFAGKHQPLLQVSDLHLIPNIHLDDVLFVLLLTTLAPSTRTNRAFTQCSITLYRRVQHFYSTAYLAQSCLSLCA
jgi:FYVE zinc finger